VECREYGLSARGFEISLYDSYTMSQSRIRPWAIYRDRFIYLLYGRVFIKRYSDISIGSWWADTDTVYCLISRCSIGVSCDRPESVLEITIPVRLSYWGYFSCVGSSERFFCLSKRGEVIHRAIDTSKYEEGEYRAEPFLLATLTWSVYEMFHKLYKKSKIIITQYLSWVNNYL
jgi:hypothetical protein